MIRTDAPTTDRQVVVSASALGDLLDLAYRAADRLPDSDPLAREMRGAAAQVRSIAVVEPR